MPDRTRLRSAVAGITLCLASPLTLAWSAPPSIQTTLVDLITVSSSDATTDGVITDTEDAKASSSNGFSAMQAASGLTGPNGGVAYSSAFHKFYSGAFGIAGEFLAYGDAVGVPDSSTILGSRARNEGEIRFTLSTDGRVRFAYYMEIDASGSSFFSGGDGLSRVILEGTRPDGTTFILSRLILADEDNNPVIRSSEAFYDIKAGTEVVLTYQMSAFAGVVFPETHYAETVCAFSLTLVDESDQPIDADDDGIPDDWEENGVDFDGDGVPEIDLPAIREQYGVGGGGTIAAGRKTLFVELDAQNGVAFDDDAIQMVRQAFADAPVSNEDGSTGIDLIIVTDETDLVNQEYDGNAWPQAFDDEKTLHFGTPALRAMPNWETEIKPVYATIFRYGIWGQTMFRDEELEGGGTRKVYFSGKAELPGNDFFVSAGEVMSWYSDAAMRTDALAGTLMHEFGHNLNLRHGGQDNENYKPNYFSVMNYTFQIPSRNTASTGRALADAWFLDYASTDVMTLNETMLREDDGLDGPAGKLTMFNTATDSNPPSLLLVDADSPEIDWDGSGAIDTEPVSVDVSRLRDDEDSLQTILNAESDWDKLWYHLSGDDDFADGSHTSTAAIEPFTFEQFELLNTYPVIDLSTPTCDADLNGDGIVDLGDIQSFIALFLVQDLAVDFNADGIVDLGDIQVFIANFLEGC